MIYRDEVREAVIEILRGRVGKKNAISANQLYCMATGDYIVPARAANQTRIIRFIIRDIRNQRVLPVMSGNGYWVAESDEELRAFVQKQITTARRMFGLANALSGIPIDRMVEQLKLELNEDTYARSKQN